MDYRIIRKNYSKEDNLFHIIKEKKYTFETEEKTYDSFDKFYKAVNKDLADADLLDYTFENINLNEYDLSKAKISSDTMIKLGTYKDNLFKIISKDNDLARITPSSSLDLVPSRQLNVETEEENDFVLCYISDLHLNHKLINEFKRNVNKFELESYFTKILLKLKNSLPAFTYNHSVVFIGDISYNFEVFKMFFKLYRQVLPYEKTFVILGNHELWDEKLNNSCNSIEEVVEKYRNYLSSLESKILLLENQLYLPHDEQHIYSQEEILNLSNEVLREKFLLNSYAVFGGLGYAGMNNEFNVNQGIYRTAPINRQQEIERSNIVNNIHQKLTKVASDKNLFFITHMPKKDWSDDKYNKNWFYLSGHTHQNYYFENEDKKFYADNQIGYTGTSFGFKYLTTSREFDIFQDYSDGIYEITREQYKMFYYGIGNRIDFNRDFETLYMLKKNGIYCFLIKLTNSKDLKLLNGGSIKNIGNQDLNYFYENLVNYSNSIKLFLKDYDDYQKKISNEIKKIGGSGHIHGSIIDIDFYNHLYINPLDATVTPYFAYSIIDKYVYTNLISLLKANNKELYSNYKKMIGLEDANKSLMALNNDLNESNKKTYVSETEMYRVSRILKGFQYTTKNNIVRLWNDTIISNSTKESGRLIVSGLINPEEMKKIKKEQRKLERQKIIVQQQNKKKSSKPHLTEEEKRKMLFEKYCDKISKINTNVVVLSYNGAKEKAKYKCLQCEYVWERRADHFIERNNATCPNCKNK